MKNTKNEAIWELKEIDENGNELYTVNTDKGPCEIYMGHPYYDKVLYSARIAKPNGTVKWAYGKSRAQIYAIARQIKEANKNY